MPEIKSQKVAYVDIVTADGDRVPGFSAPVPASWIGTDLLPEGVKRAPTGPKVVTEPARVDIDKIRAEIEAEVRAQIEAEKAAAEQPKG